MNYLVKVFISCMMLTSAHAVAAGWQLDEKQSTLNFISVKKVNVAEVHKFTHFAGEIDAAGKVVVNIDLASVETLVPIRNERMKAFLFQTDIFPEAILTAQLDQKLLDTIKNGESKVIELDTELSLHGSTDELAFEVTVTRLSSNKVLVISTQPIILHADDFELTAGIDKLRELAKLPSISHAVPVTFSLTFTQQ